MNLKKFKFVWLLAKRDLFEDKRITIIVIAMLSFSFLNLAFFPAFIEGLTDTFNAALIETQTGHIAIHPEEGIYLENVDSLERKISRLKGVKNVEKRLKRTVHLHYRDETVTAQLIGSSSLSDIYKSRIQSGEFLSSGDEKKIVLGTILASQDGGLDVKRGRRITVQSDTYNYTQLYQVKGTIGRPGPGGLTSQAIIPYTEAEEMIGREDVATSIKILLKSRSPEEFKLTLQELNIGGEIETWGEQSQMAMSISQTFGIVTITVSIVGVVIALTSVGVVIFINTNKRSREMGIVRAIGSNSGEIVQIFVLEALLLGVSGVIIGNVVLLALDGFLASNPISAPMGPMTTVVSSQLLWTRSLIMLLSSLIAGFIPAYLISKQNIVETIEQR